MLIYYGHEVETSKVLEDMGLSPEEAAPLFKKAGISMDQATLGPADHEKLDRVVGRVTMSWPGEDWRIAGREDRQRDPAVGSYDVFHRTTYERRAHARLGDLLRWSQALYGWKLE